MDEDSIDLVKWMRVRGISVSFAVIVMLIISTGSLISDIDENAVLTTPDSNRISQLSYEIHDPIIITSDADFEMQSVNEGREMVPKPTPT